MPRRIQPSITIDDPSHPPPGVPRGSLQSPERSLSPYPEAPSHEATPPQVPPESLYSPEPSRSPLPEAPSREAPPPPQTPLQPVQQTPIPVTSTQSSTPPIKRRRVRPPTPPPPTQPSPQPQADADDENICTICLEAWTNSGEHQLCCMPCGHLFGYACISNWLKSQPRRTRACPTCKTPGRVKDLRYLFGVPSTLKTTDTTETDSLRKQLSDERQRHRETRQRLEETRRLAKDYRNTMMDLQRARVALMQGPPQAVIDDISLIGVRRTKGGSISVACDGPTVLYTENIHGTISEQRLCRTEIHRLNYVNNCVHTFSKRVNAISVCAQSEMSRYIAAASADRRLTVLNPSLQLATEVTVSAVPTSVAWLSTPHLLAVGLLNGEVAIYDIRRPSGPCLRPLVAQHGWRAVHSLGEVNTDQGTRLIAGAPCGVVTISEQSGFVDHIELEEGPITGVSVHEGYIMVATKPDKPKLSIYDGLTTSDGTVELGKRVGGVLTGYKHDTPFIQPAILPGVDRAKGSMVLCPDTASEHGVARWGFRRDGLDGERWVRQGNGTANSVGVRAIACASIPPTAKIAGLPEKVRGVFAAVGDDCVRVFSAGRYREAI